MVSSLAPSFSKYAYSSSKQNINVDRRQGPLPPIPPVLERDLPIKTMQNIRPSPFGTGPLATNVERSMSPDDRSEPYNIASKPRSEDSGQVKDLSKLHAREKADLIKPRTRPQNLSMKERKRKRPGLTIITDFSKPEAHAYIDGVRVEQAKAQNARAAMTRAKSVVSVKPEHVIEASPTPKERLPPLVSLKDIAALRRAQKIGYVDNNNERTQSRQAKTGDNAPNRHHNLEINKNTRDGSIFDGSSSQPINAARTQRTDKTTVLSVSTPTTPAIIITPADEEHKRLPQESRLRPPSSIYSAITPKEAGKKQFEHVPPVPALPFRFNPFNAITNEDPFSNKSESEDEWWDSENADEQSEEEIQHQEEQQRHSSESQEEILSSGDETARPKSQGWWNLMLSPVLSRAGTLKHSNGVIPGQAPDIPPVPKLAETVKSRTVVPQNEMSPETPRRAGLATAFASSSICWSDVKRNPRSDRSMETASDQPKDGSLDNRKTNGSEVTVPFMIEPSPIAKGLAAEYYQACAIEQLDGTKYFQCQNHSCADKSPALKSIFDTRPVVKPVFENERSVQARDNVLADFSMHGLNHARSQSDSTNAFTEPEELSPNVRHASTIAIMKARALNSSQNPATTVREDPKLLNQWQRFQSPWSQVAGVKSGLAEFSLQTRDSERKSTDCNPLPSSITRDAAISSPRPITPEAQRSMATSDAVPMTMVKETAKQQPLAVPISNRLPQADKDSHAPPTVIYSSYPRSEPIVRYDIAKQDYVYGNEEKKPKPRPFVQRLGCLHRKRTNRDATSNQRNRRRIYILIAIILLLIVIACVVLATQLTRRGDQTPVQTQWLNLTGYPPMMIGISTVVRPNNVISQSSCVQSTTLWSCALPKENQAEVVPNGPDQPNFRFEVKFRNGTVPANMTIPLPGSPPNAQLPNQASDPFTNDLFNSNPSPPSRADQIFMGNTTDNITFPFDGEETPFFVSFIPAFPIDPSSSTTTTSPSNRLLKPRQSTNLTNSIPPPSILPDGSAAPANLFPTSPYLTSQPLRLHNRGQPDEHYGFYTYFDKSIFLSSPAILDTSPNSFTSSGPLPADANGGSSRTSAAARCTFSQTRFKVSIFTSSSFGSTLIAPVNTTLPSATNFSPPGSFPYPTTITLDRHGGDMAQKAVYCYGMNGLQEIGEDVKSVVAEFRGIGGRLINPAPGLISASDDDTGFDRNAGGIDGGTGGCSCSWQNWI